MFDNFRASAAAVRLPGIFGTYIPNESSTLQVLERGLIAPSNVPRPWRRVCKRSRRIGRQYQGGRITSVFTFTTWQTFQRSRSISSRCQGSFTLYLVNSRCYIIKGFCIKSGKDERGCQVFTSTNR